MARSCKRSPAGGNLSARSDAWWKAKSQRAWRRRVRMALIEDRPLPNERTVRNVRQSPKDGHGWYGSWALPLLLRK